MGMRVIRRFRDPVRRCAHPRPPAGSGDISSGAMWSGRQARHVGLRSSPRPSRSISLDANPDPAAVWVRDGDRPPEASVTDFAALLAAPAGLLLVGLDHVSFAVASRAELDAAVALLDERGVGHDGLKDIGAGFILEFRDPDNIALELFAPKG